jgi:TPR repeat protein
VTTEDPKERLFEEAEIQTLSENYTDAFALYKQSAELGHPSAQFQLGYFFENGIGTPVSIIDAIHWYKKAAEMRHVIAQYNLGLLYEEGFPGLEPDLEKAVEYFCEAASNGDDDAMYRLGVINQERDPEKSYDWYLRASKLGNEKAQYMIGNCHEYGIGREVDYV